VQLCSRVLSFESGQSDFVAFFWFLTPNEGEEVKLGAHFGVVKKPIADFLIPDH